MNRSNSNSLESLYNIVPAELRNSVFSTLFNTPSTSNTIATTVIKSEEKIIVFAEMPGFNKSSINVDFFNNKLNIEGDKEAPDDETGRVLSSHIKYGKFIKCLALPVSVTNRSNVTVNYNNGILKITINLQRESENKFSVSLEQKDVDRVII